MLNYAWNKSQSPGEVSRHNSPNRPVHSLFKGAADPDQQKRRETLSKGSVFESRAESGVKEMIQQEQVITNKHDYVNRMSDYLFLEILLMRKIQ